MPLRLLLDGWVAERGGWCAPAETVCLASHHGDCHDSGDDAVLDALTFAADVASVPYTLRRSGAVIAMILPDARSGAVLIPISHFTTLRKTIMKQAIWKKAR